MNIQKYESVFYYQLGYLSTNSEQNIYRNKFDEIRPSIEKTIKFVDKYEFEDNQEDIRVRAVAVLPFLMTEVIENPHLETRAKYKRILEFLEFIRNEKFLANHIINRTTINKKENTPITFDDFYGFDMDKIDSEIDIYKKLLSMKKSIKRKWYSNVMQLGFLCIGLSNIYGKEEKKIINFLYNFFMEFNKEVDSDIIKQKILVKSRKDPFLQLNQSLDIILPPKLSK